MREERVQPSRIDRRGWLARALVAVLALAAPVLAGQGKPAKPPKPSRPNDPIGCPYCFNDPALMAAAGIVSHGGFEFGKTDTKRVDAALPSCDIRWIETPNLKIGFGIGSQKVKFEEKKKMLAELTRLAAVLPEVVPESTILDPWLRAHLYAQRCEDIHARFLVLMGAKGAQFADGSGTYTGDYRGEGPYLGQKAKYEVLVLPSESAHTQFLTDHAGEPLKVSHRWHNVGRGAIGIYCHAQQGQLRQDGALHGHIAFNLAHIFYDGFNHYTYDTPVWIHEGIAHALEREVDERYNSFDSGEGGVAEMTSKANWKPDVLRLISSGEAPRMTELLKLSSFAELKLPHHYTTWSMIDYLIKTNPEGLGAFLRAMKTNLDSRGVPSGENLADHHRKVFKEHLGMSYAEFDEAWRAWVLLNYRGPGPKGTDPAAPATGSSPPPVGGAGGPPAGG